MKLNILKYLFLSHSILQNISSNKEMLLNIYNIND